MKKILLIIPYFGNLNASGYFQVFLESCAFNETVQFLLLTDDRTKYDYPANMLVQYTTLAELKDRFQAYFDFPISLERAYKLCDYKLAYGELFSDEIEGYDCWGFCDTDMIFGNLRKFITDEQIEQYGRLYTRGHLSIFRCDVPRDFYKLQFSGMPSYQDVLSSSDSYSYDEWINRNDEHDALKHTGYRVYFNLDNMDIAPPGRSNPVAFRRAESSRDPEISANEKRISKMILYFEKGKLYRLGITDKKYLLKNEVLYAHFQKRKMRVVGDLSASTFVVAPNYLKKMGKMPHSIWQLRRLNLHATGFAFFTKALKNKMPKHARRK